jgi:ATP-dependent DNA helicase RecG
MTPKFLQSQIALGEDSKRQFKVDVRNAESLAAEMAAFANSILVSYVAKGLLPYHGLGSGGNCNFGRRREVNRLLRFATATIVEGTAP